MRQPLADVPSSVDLVDRLAAHKTLGSAPRAELEWLAANGELRRYPAGAHVVTKGEPITEMVVQLTGRVTTMVDRGTGRRHMFDSVGGDVTALLPFSRMGRAIGEVVVVEPAEALIVPRDQFPDLIRECPGIIEILVHTMIDRAQHLASTSWQDDKMASLGRLAAGLAHELNNPASAAARSAKRLGEALKEATEASQALGAAKLTGEQRAEVASFADGGSISSTTGVFSALERADHEDTIIEWLEDHGASTAQSATLSESGVTTEALDKLAESFEGETLNIILRWLASEYTTRTLASEVERATTRIHDLVSAVKRFTYLNRAATPAPTNIAQGLADTVTVLASKARGKSVAMRLELQPGLPTVIGNAGELNQVWANLMENALDATNENGRVTVSAVREAGEVVVRVVDDGPGVPPDIEARIFEPFFTTKPIGQGTGLGLDISRRIVVQHGGTIAVQSKPGRTEFRVGLPTEGPKSE